MALSVQTIAIWTIVLLALLSIFLLSMIQTSASSSASNSSIEPTMFSTSSLNFFPEFEDTWITRLAVNLIGYATVFIPGFFLKYYIQRSKYLDVIGEKGFTKRLAQLCFRGVGDDPQLGTVESKDVPSGSTLDGKTGVEGKSSSSISEWRGLLMVLCFFGLLGSYLTWGLLQEKIMTREYVSADGGKERFVDSQFLVFVNRILAFILSGAYIFVTRQPQHRAPLYKYCYCSFSNVMSSWCQYEALKYVSFPTQVLAKASKIIPVMLMGKIVSRKKYEYYEYVTAVAISVGMTLFLLGSETDHGRSTMTTFSGVIILASYMIFDSFTSNWQGELFTRYRMTSMQMMCGVNLFSCIFTTVSLLQQGGFVDSFYFTLRNSEFIVDISLLSLTSATGQLFIFYTIAQFGPIVFVIMMTIRQGLAILLSCIVYQHSIAIYGVFGILLVFIAIFMRIYCSQRIKRLKRYQRVPSASHKV